MMDRNDLAALAKSVREYISAALVGFITKDDLERRLAQLPKAERGEKGETGERGVPGDAGAMGPRGEKGEKGDVGERGERGDSGPIGDRGSDGVRGEKGETGEKGPAGINGIDGKDGRDGRDGKDGKDGAHGRDALQIEILAAIDIAKSFPRGTFAHNAGGLLRARANTTAGQFISDEWEVVMDGLYEVDIVQGDNERTFTFKMLFASGREFAKQFTLPVPIYRGVWLPEGTYERADTVTYDGSCWHCETKDTKAKPGMSDDWRLIVRAGRDYRPPKEAAPIQEPVRLR